MSSASVAAPRRNRDPHPTKPNAPSMISIFSAHSTSSEASGGSVSTVTAESSSRTRSRDLRHVKSKHGGQRLGSGTSRARPQVRVRGESTLPNVFDYLDKDGHSRNASHVSLGEVESDPTTPHAAAFAHASPIDALNFQNDESDKDSGAQSLHSDSGISIRDSSPEPPKSLSFPLATAGEPCEPQNSSYLPLVSRPRLRHVRSRRVYRPDNKSSVAADYERPSPKPNTTFDTTSPESYYLGAVATKSRDMPTPEREVSQSAGASPAIETSKTSPISSGYALLASRLTSRLSPKQAGIPPLYRKFEGLNHRILLQLQDEIAEMEEELKTLDEADRQCRIAAQSKPTDPVIPASRRLDWQCQRFSALHSRRLDLLGKIYVKVEQYNQALCAFNNVSKSLSPATPADIETYRKWMAANSPIAKMETAFLDHAADLVQLRPGLHRAEHAPLAKRSAVYFAVAVAAVAIILPLLAFSAIGEYFGRLVVVAIVGGAVSLFIGASKVGDLLGDRQIGIGALVYFAIMAVAAIFAP